MAVTPIAIPISKRRAAELGMSCMAGREGSNRRTVKTQAESMNARQFEALENVELPVAAECPRCPWVLCRHRFLWGFLHRSASREHHANAAAMMRGIDLRN